MKVINRKISREFAVLETFEAGIALTGAEVKAVRLGRVRLEDSFVKIVDNKVQLLNCDISPYEYARPESYDSKRTRSLLLHKFEILRLKTKLAGAGNLTIVATSCYTKKSRVKLQIALVRGRKTWEVKRVEKERDEKRRIEKEMKEYGNG